MRIDDVGRVLRRSRLVLAGLALRLGLMSIFVIRGAYGVAAGGAPGTAEVAAASGRFALAAAILAFDLAALAALAAIVALEHRRKLLIAYWFCPATLFFFYVQGRLDGLSIVLLLWALVLVDRMRFLRGGAVFGAAVASAAGLSVVAPLFAMYFVGRSRLRGRAAAVLGVAAAVAAAVFALLLHSPYRGAALHAPEVGSLFDLSVTTAPGLRIYLFPLVYVALLTAAWRIRMLNFELLWALIALTLAAMLLLATTSPVWGVWVLPLFALHAARADPTGLPLFGAFSLALLALHVFLGAGWSAGSPPEQAAASLACTLVLALGGALALQLFRRSVVRSSFRQTLKRPVVIGVSGDSGSGKDTLVESLVAIVGRPAVAHVSGDDYHAWDRNKPMWRALTHLNPKANDLDRFQRNVATLVDRRWIRAPHYDHSTGRMTKPTHTGAAEFVAVSGLHALWSPSLNALYDIRIFLDMDEDLRRRLKIRRDVHERGHPLAKVLKSMEQRYADSRRFIHPQAAAADLILKLEPRHPPSDDDAHAPGASGATPAPPLRLVMRARPGQDFEELARLLTAFCGMQVVEAAHASGWTQVMIEGEPTAVDIGAAGRRLAPECMELLDVEPRWEAGLKGVMQLIILDQINRVRLRRWLNA